MNKLLFIDGCVRKNSRTLALAKHLLKVLGEDYDEVNVTNGDFKPLDGVLLQKRTENIEKNDYSDGAFDCAKQFLSAEKIVIAVPFWDLSFPSFLKIYFENVLVSGLTFVYENGRPQGLCKAKTLYYVTTAGGYISVDFGFSYVKALAENFFGIRNVVCFKAEGLDVKYSDADAILKTAKEQIDKKCKK